MKYITRAVLICASVWGVTLNAGVTRDLPYPSGSLSADEIAKQVFFVNHFYSVNNLFIQRQGKTHVTVLATRAKGEKADINTLKRYLNNDYKDGVVRSKDIALFHSGKLRGTGILITDFLDDNKSQTNAVWLPALKKIRRYNEPPQDDSWGKSDFTYGDVYLRKPQHENHEILETNTFNDCLGSMNLSDKESKNRYLKQLYPSQCDHKGKKVYKLKSTTKFKNWWYDYRISYIDTTSFADYRVEYFKKDQKVKVIDKDWVSMGLSDPRGVFWRYWYGKNLITEHETMINVPEKFVSWNKEIEDNDILWSEDMLKKMRE